MLLEVSFVALSVSDEESSDPVLGLLASSPESLALVLSGARMNIPTRLARLEYHMGIGQD